MASAVEDRLLREKIIKNISYIEEKYLEKNNIIAPENAGYVNILNMFIILTLIATISISIACFLLRR